MSLGLLVAPGPYRLAAIDALRTQQASLEHDLTERLSPLFAARETLQRILNEDNATLEELRADQNARQQIRGDLPSRSLSVRRGAGNKSLTRAE